MARRRRTLVEQTPPFSERGLPLKWGSCCFRATPAETVTSVMCRICEGTPLLKTICCRIHVQTLQDANTGAVCRRCPCRHELSAPLPAEMYLSAQRGELQNVAKWLRKGGLADALCPVPNFHGQTETAGLLHTTATHGHLEIVRELLKRGASVDLQSGHGATPLMNAALRGHLSVLLVLLQHSANPDLHRHPGHDWECRRPGGRQLLPCTAPTAGQNTGNYCVLAAVAAGERKPALCFSTTTPPTSLIVCITSPHRTCRFGSEAWPEAAPRTASRRCRSTRGRCWARRGRPG